MALQQSPTSTIPLIRLSDDDDDDGDDDNKLDANLGDADTNNNNNNSKHNHHHTRTGDATAFSVTARRVVEALQTTGFLLVQSHHLPIKLQNDALQATNELFRRVKETPQTNDDNDGKTTNKNINNSPPPTVGIVHHPTDPKSYVMLDCHSRESLQKELEAINTASTNPHDTTQPLVAYVEGLEKVKVQLLEYIAVGLDLPKDFLVQLHRQRNSVLRLLQYHAAADTTAAEAANDLPPSSFLEEPKNDATRVKTAMPRLRCKAHSDYGSITLLLTERPGLQAFVSTTTSATTTTTTTSQEKIDDQTTTTKSNNRHSHKRKRVDPDQDTQPGEWVDVPHVEGALVVNIGSILSEWTQGRLLATLHRVIHMSDGSRDDHGASTRTSLAYFADPDPNVSTDTMLGATNLPTAHDGADSDVKQEKNPNDMSVAEYIAWRSGGTDNDRSGVAFTDREKERIAANASQIDSLQSSMVEILTKRGSEKTC